MLKNIIVVLAFCVTTNIYSQDNTFFRTTYTNSNSNVEFGLGYVFKTKYDRSFVRYQVASRNLFMNKKLGLMYTIESASNELLDVFGINYRISNNLSFQVGSGLAINNIFNTKNSRKEISLAYHPNYIPLTITTGYSKSFGPSLTVNYRIFLNKKKEKVKVQEKSKQLNKKVYSDKLANRSNIKKSETVAKPNPKTQTIKQASQKTKIKANNNLGTRIEKPSAVVKTNTKSQATKQASQKITDNINNNLENTIKKSIEQKAVVQKVIKKPTINTKELCDESTVLYSLNTYELSSSEKKNLQKLAEYLKANLKSKLKIFGSTDKSGSEEYNLNLGAKRANSAKDYLIQLGVSSKQLETISLGESKSQNANSEWERAKARSTTFEITP